MNFRELTTGAYLKLHESIATEGHSPLTPYLGYEYEKGEPDFAYDWQENDFTRELVNSYNQFSYWLTRIQLWESIFAEYNEDDVEELRYEFTKIPLDFCLQFPYQFRSRLIFCSTQLCYVKAIAAKRIDKSKVKNDSEINLSTLIEVACNWTCGAALVSAIKAIDSPQFRADTKDYRNKTQHRLAQRLDFGHTAFVERTCLRGAHIGYHFGQNPPIMASEVIPILAAEAEHLIAAFNAYRALVNEQTYVPT